MIGKLLFALLSVNLGIGGVHAQTPVPIKSATLHVARRVVPELAVQITNHRPAAIEQFALGVSGPDGAGAGSWTPKKIAPGETLEHRMPFASPEQATVTLNFVEFADGHLEGTPEYLRHQIELREQTASELSYWIDVVKAMPRGSNEEAAAHLQAAARRRGMSAADARSPYVKSLLSSPAVHQLATLTEYVNRSIADMEAELARVTRHRGRVANVETAAVSSDSVTLRFSPAPGGELVAILENHARAPLDAWSIVEYSETGAVQSSRIEDTCGASRDDPKTGSIQPGERREIAVLQRVDINDRRSRRFQLSMVLFRDGRFEGSAEEFAKLRAARAARDCR